ncbi:MAG: hypothetical protein N5P05_003736 [Chroococcopsis gigantea SAG 12.99]|jgi:rSAM-associated Gly-rich repeat protein|nr:hypothetical protein [Chroococcopsis gigantea SAG 12.99]
MNISSRIGLVGFILTISTITGVKSAQATDSQSPLSIEARLNRLTNVINERSNMLPDSTPSPVLELSVWANTRGGSWVNAGGGGFINSRPAWRNGWSDGGSFFNSRPNWRNGGSFFNR